jgi:hypothetical protein
MSLIFLRILVILVYIEYQSVCPLVEIGSPPLPPNRVWESVGQEAIPSWGQDVTNLSQMGPAPAPHVPPSSQGESLIIFKDHAFDSDHCQS